MRIEPVQIKPLDDAGAVVADGAYLSKVVGGVLVGLLLIDTTILDATQLVSVTNGVPSNVYDTDGQIVYTEVSA